MTRTETATASPATPPFWARPAGVVLFCSLWAGFHFFVAAFLRSALVQDDARESYHAQSLELFYASRNPSLYGWLLHFVDKITVTSFIGAPLINYASLLACALLFYMLSRRVISDPRLQALSVYSLSLLWVVGFESHRILAHSQVMIALIAAALLVFHSLGERKTVWKYLLLGALVPFGVLVKYAYGLFMLALIAAAFVERNYRRVVLDARFLLTLAVGLAPLALYAVLATQTSAIVGTSTYILTTGSGEPFLKITEKLIGAFAGYALPFAAIFGLVFFLPMPPRKTGARGPDEAFLRILRTILLVGVLVMLAWGYGLGSTQLRPRYLHCLFLPLPLYAFMVLDRYEPTRRSVRSYLVILAAMAVTIAGIYLAGRLAPSQALCDTCRPSVPYRQLGRELANRYKPLPDLVAATETVAGQLRAAVPTARVVALYSPEYAPPPSTASRCLLVWPEGSEEVDGVASLMQDHGIALSPDETVTLDWWAPLLSRPRQTSFHLQELRADAAPCRDNRATP